MQIDFLNPNADPQQEKEVICKKQYDIYNKRRLRLLFLCRRDRRGFCWNLTGQSAKEFLNVQIFIFA